MRLPVIVLGAGGHARVLLDALRLTGVKVMGVTDASPTSIDNTKLDAAILGDDRAVLRYRPASVLLVNGLGSVRTTEKRTALFDRFKRKGYRFATVIHPSAVIARNVILGEGAQVMAGSVIQTGSKIGENTIVNTRVSIDHDCCVGAHTHIAPGSVFSGGVTVGQGCHIGPGSVVIQGCCIAPGSFIRAQSLIKKDHSADRSRRARATGGKEKK